MIGFINCFLVIYVGWFLVQRHSGPFFLGIRCSCSYCASVHDCILEISLTRSTATMTNYLVLYFCIQATSKWRAGLRLYSRGSRFFSLPVIFLWREPLVVLACNFCFFVIYPLSRNCLYFVVLRGRGPLSWSTNSKMAKQCTVLLIPILIVECTGIYTAIVIE